MILNTRQDFQKHLKDRLSKIDMTIRLLKKKKNINYNQFHNILGLFNVFPHFPFTTSETINMGYKSCLTSCRTN